MKLCPHCQHPYGDDRTHCPRDGTELRAVADPLVNRVLPGGYRLTERVAAGGMSSVYRASREGVDRPLAVKVLRRALAGDAVQRDRFLREAGAVDRIDHPNVVRVEDFGETEDGLVFLVMEYVEGTPLLSIMGRGRLPIDQGLHIAAQVAGALGTAHRHGVIHRDLKPENILLTCRDGDPRFVKVLDFGIAKILDAPSLTGSQQIFGTPGYIAPEYIQSNAIDGRADVYSLGVILYELITGALPFDYEYPADLLAKHVTEEPIPPHVRDPAVPPEIDALLLRCLCKDPNERFDDCEQFLRELDRARHAAGIELDDRPPAPRDPLPTPD
ncbi:MAG: serine/threonine-protein kinase [Myxococcota bacterium]